MVHLGRLLMAVAFGLQTMELGAPRQAPSDEVQKALAELREQQATLRRDLKELMRLVETLAASVSQSRQRSAALIGSTLQLPARPAKGAAAAPVTVVEVADYHCPFCRRAQAELATIEAEYVATNTVRIVVVDYPIATLHPYAARSHLAAACAAEQGRYWEMHRALYSRPPAIGVGELVVTAESLGIDLPTFRTCLSSELTGVDLRRSADALKSLGIEGTPVLLIGRTPVAGAPFVVRRYVYGAQPYLAYKTAIEATLQELR